MDERELKVYLERNGYILTTLRWMQTAEERLDKYRLYRAVIERAVSRLERWECERNGCVSDVADELRAALDWEGKS
jgi:hypothetical protein